MITTFKTFYTFPQLDERQGRLVVCWVRDPRLYRHLEAILRKDPLVTEAILARRFLSALQQNTEDALVKRHLIAFLSQESLRAANKVKNDLKKHTSLSVDAETYLQDLLQVALESVLNPLTFLKDFNLDKTQQVFWYPALKKYIHRKLQGILIDRIRDLEGTRTFRRTDLGLAGRVTEKRVIDSLKYDGHTSDRISRLVLGWKCFKEARKAGRINISSPQPQQFREIADRYNQLRHGLPLTTEQNPAINGAIIEEWLNQIGKAIRRYIDRSVDSLEATLFGEDSDSLMDVLPDESMVNDAEIQEKREQADALKNLIVRELEALENSEQRIPLFKHGLRLVQVQISTELDITQPTVGRRYQRLLLELIREIAQGEWRSQLGTEESIELSSESLEILKKELIEQLDDYYADLIYPNFRVALANLSLQQLKALQCQYISQLDITAIAGKLQISEETVNSILQSARETVQQLLARFIQTRLVVTLKSEGPAREGIVVLTEEWFQTAPYQELQ